MLADILLYMPDRGSGDQPEEEIYHVQNPKRRSWGAVIAVFADELELPIIAHREWLHRIRNIPGGDESLIDFFDVGSPNAGTWPGGLDTSRAEHISEHLREAEVIDDDLLRAYANVVLSS